MSINVNDNIQSNSGKSLDNKFLKNGTVSYASVSEANSTIPLSYRSPYLTVVVGTQEYWYFGGVADINLVAKTSGGTFSLPIVRYIYLVQDASDANRMGGVPSNTYTTFQTAYDAANALQILLGGNNIVEVRVGNTIASQIINAVSAVGNLTLTADYNIRVRFVGDSTVVSVLGNILASSAIGNAFNIGTSGTSLVTFSNVAIGTITTTATGVTGNGGSLNLRLSSSMIGNINTSIINASNTNGNGGSVSLNSNVKILGGGTISVGSIQTSSKSTTSSAGSLFVFGGNMIIGGCTLANNNLGGNFSVTGFNNLISAITSNSQIASASTTNTISNCTINSLILNWCGQSASFIGDPLFKFDRCNILFLQVTNNGLNPDYLTLNLNDCIIQLYSGDSKTTMYAYNTTFWLRQGSADMSVVIADLGDNSILANCSIVKENGFLVPVIDSVGNNCKIVNCIIRGGNYSISNGVPVIIDCTNTFIEKTIDGAFVTVLINGGVPPVVDLGSGADWTYDASLSKSASIYMDKGVLNTLTINNAAIGETYILYVKNVLGIDTLNIVGAIYSGGSYVPTPIAGAKDRLLITYDGVNFWVSTTGTNFS